MRLRRYLAPQQDTLSQIIEDTTDIRILSEDNPTAPEETNRE